MRISILLAFVYSLFLAVPAEAIDTGIELLRACSADVTPS